MIFKLFCNCSYCCDDVVAVSAVAGEGVGGGDPAEAGHQQTPRVEAAIVVEMSQLHHQVRLRGGGGQVVHNPENNNTMNALLALRFAHLT